MVESFSTDVFDAGPSTSYTNQFFDFADFDFDTGTFRSAPNAITGTAAGEHEGERQKANTETSEPPGPPDESASYDDLFDLNLEGEDINPTSEAIMGIPLGTFDLSDGMSSFEGGINLCAPEQFGIDMDPIMELFSSFEQHVSQSQSVDNQSTPSSSSSSDNIPTPQHSISTNELFPFPTRDEQFSLHSPTGSTPSATWRTTPALGPASDVRTQVSFDQTTTVIPRDTIYPIPVDADGRPDPNVLTALGLPPLGATVPRTSAAGPSRTKKTNAEFHRNSRQKSPYASETRGRERDNAPTNGPTKKAKEKAKGRGASSSNAVGDAGTTTWHVITQPQSIVAESTVASQVATSAKRIKRKKDVFHRVERPGVKSPRPEWFNPPPQSPVPMPDIPKRDRGPHSEMGWVLARLREPHCERAQYGWAVAEIHNPYANTYLILSGPHCLQIKTVRPYDRVAYSQEAIDKLKSKNALSEREKVYDEIALTPEQVVTRSSVYGTDLAFNQVSL